MAKGALIRDLRAGDSLDIVDDGVVDRAWFVGGVIGRCEKTGDGGGELSRARLQDLTVVDGSICADIELLALPSSCELFEDDLVLRHSGVCSGATRSLDEEFDGFVDLTIGSISCFLVGISLTAFLPCPTR